MKFYPTPLSGAYLVEIEALVDERGYFGRTFCRDEFARHGLCTDFPQCNTSFNIRRNTLRGMHYQTAPHAEAKLIRCTRGAIHDVILDLRKESPTYLRWAGFDLTEDNQLLLYVPEGFAHGFQTLADHSEVFYQMGNLYCSEAAQGCRWNDPLFGIRWPLADPTLSARDAGYPDYQP